MAVPLPQDVSPEVLAAYKRKFDAIDLNKDGLIELREMAAISRVFGYKLSIDELRVRVRWPNRTEGNGGYKSSVWLQTQY